MKTVKMLVSMAGPDESYQPGDERTVDDAVAKEWQDLGISITLPESKAVVEKHKAKTKPGRKPKAKAKK